MTHGGTHTHGPEAQIQKLEELNFDQLRIPPYQRPYKWTIKNVNQLIDDLLYEIPRQENLEAYRLGTLVLHENNIVDGQQRIITLALLFYQLLNKLETEQKQDVNKELKSKYNDFHSKIRNFCQNTKFSSPISKENIRINAGAIDKRLCEISKKPDKFDLKLLMFLLEKCEFVVVSLSTIDEAFQFFDSQNSRGKELLPHDLLKAFHIREIPESENGDDENNRDDENIRKWEETDTKKLAELFEYLYFLKSWLKGEKGDRFTKDKIDIFKGISLKGPLYPQSLSHIISHAFSTLPKEQSLGNCCLDSFSVSIGITKKDLLNALKENEDFSFQIDQPCINGTRFFEMVLHYHRLLSEIQDSNAFRKTVIQPSKKISAAQIVEFLNSYSKRNRTGDYYVRWLFNSLLLLYVDKFGWYEIDKATRKIFLWTYGIRLARNRVDWDYAIDSRVKDELLFKALRDAVIPDDILNCICPIYEKASPENKDQDNRVGKIKSSNPDLFPFYEKVRDGQ